MMSEPKEFVKPTRKQRMTGVDIQIDGECWAYVLEHLFGTTGIPADTPLEELQVRRYACKGGRIILKVKRV